MSRNTVKRARGYRLPIFELLESRLCLSASAVLEFPYWTFLDTNVVESSAIEVNRAITTDSSAQQGPSIAADPQDPDHIVVAYMDYSLSSHGYAGIGVAVSRDEGASWEHTAIDLPSGFDQGASDLIANFDSDGHVFVSFMAASFKGEKTPPILNPNSGDPRALGFEANNGIFVARSDDGGLTWLSPVAVASHDYDGITKVPFEVYPDMAVDNIRELPSGQANPNFGNLYVTWARYYPAHQFPGEPNAKGGSDVMIAVSEDSGLTWQLRTQSRAESGVIDSVLQTVGNTGSDQDAGRGYLNWPRVSVGAQGDVAVADFVGSWFFVNHSNDAGQTFFVPTQDKPVGLPFGPGAKLLTAGLSNNSFRPVPTRGIVADPVRPGRLYVAEPLPILDSLGNPLDSADIYFARSEDFGRTWKSIKFPNSTASRSLNDDNGGKRSNGSPQDVAADQFMVRMQVNASGDIGVVWYDTRRDPANHLLDVFAAISTDGGVTFSPNFRVTDQSFDADAGDFTSVTGQALGFPNNNRLGLALTEDSAYVAWTDTRAGNQDVFFRKLLLHPTPASLNDRFEPNDVLTDATDLGNVVTNTFPRLSLDAGDADWFRLKSSASGTLTVNIRSTDSPEKLGLRVFDSDGQQIVGESELLRDAAGVVVSRQVKVASLAGQLFTVQVSSVDTTATYSLETSSLTENLGPLVLRNVTGSLQANDQLYYLFESTAAGVIVANLVPLPDAQGDAQIELLDAQDLSKLTEANGDSPQLSLAVMPGQRLLLRVTASSLGTSGFQGAFALQLENFDQYSSPAQRTLQFPAGAGPSQMAIGDFNGDGITDVAVTNTGVNTVSVMLGNGSNRNGDGTFSAPRQFGVGAFQAPNPVGDDANLNTFRRDVLAADFNHDGNLDLVITNWDSADVSVLLGRGDGTFQPQRRFNAAAFPIGVTSGDVNNDGNLDLVVIDSPEINVPNKLAVLLGRGDGTFQPQKLQDLPKILFLAVAALGDLDNNGTLDLVVGGGINDGLDIFRGVGDGTFESLGRVNGSRQAASLDIKDLNGDGNLDVVAPSLSDNNAVTILLGTGDLNFQAPIEIDDVGQGPLVVRVVDLGSQVEQPDGTFVVGPPDGVLDLIVANSGVIPGPFISIGAPGVVLLPGLTDAKGTPAGFGAPFTLAPAEQPLDLELADFDGDHLLDIAVVDRDGFFVIYANTPSIQPNVTQATARDLGTFVHTVQPTLTIGAGREDSWFRLNVASESVAAAGDQVIDFSAGFAQITGAGLRMEVIDAVGRQRGVGDRFHVAASQGETLFVHVFSRRDGINPPGAGAYTLVIDTLPQLVTVEASALLPGLGSVPGGPTSSLVLVFQGDRLDPTAAENPNNYRVIWLGPDSQPGGGDDRLIVVGAGIESAQPVVYSPSGNRDVASGHNDPSAVRQTVTLEFAEALPSGSYIIEVLPQVQAAAFNTDELGLLSARGFAGHGVVSLALGQIQAGVRRTFDNLVSASGALGNFSAFESGTRFLTQLHADLGAVLDEVLSNRGDNGDDIELGVLRNTGDLLNQIVARLSPALVAVGQQELTLLVLLLDPVSIKLVDPAGRSFSYDLQQNTVANNLSNSFVEVGGNVELVVIAQPPGILQLNIANVPPLARGGWVYLSTQTNTVQTLLTADIRDGATTFSLGFASPVQVFSALLSAPQLLTPSMLLAEVRAAQTGLLPSTVVAKLNLNLDPATRGFANTGLRSLNTPGSSNLRPAKSSVFNELKADFETLEAPALQLRDRTDDRGSNKDGSPENVARPTPSVQQDFNSSRIRSKLLRNRSALYESARNAIDEARTTAPLPQDAGADADRTETTSEDRRLGHRATDDHRSTPRVESISRDE